MYTKRVGVTGYCLDYKPELVNITNYVRLQSSRTGSAGVMGPMMQNGTYEFNTYGRYDVLDPAVVFSIWFYNDATKDEIDIVEYSRWRDPNNPNGYHIKVWKNEVELTNLVGVDRCFYHHKIVCVVDKEGVDAFVYGNQFGKWMKLLQCLRAPRLDYGQLRMAVWTPKAGYTYSTGVSTAIGVYTKFTPA